MPAEEMPAAAMQQQPRKAIAYGNSRYYTVAEQQHTAAAYATNAYAVSAYPVYRPMLTQVGAQQASAMAWTSEDDAYSPGNRTRRGLQGGLSDPNKDKESPVGEAWALLAFAMLYAGYTFLRRKKTENLNNNTF